MHPRGEQSGISTEAEEPISVVEFPVFPALFQSTHINPSFHITSSACENTCANIKNLRHTSPNCRNKIFFLQLVQSSNLKSCFSAISNHPPSPRKHLQDVWSHCPAVRAVTQSTQPRGWCVLEFILPAPWPGVATQSGQGTLAVPPGPPKTAACFLVCTENPRIKAGISGFIPVSVEPESKDFHKAGP